MIQDDRLPLKEKVLDYLTHMPFYRWAAKSIGKNEDTLILWRNEDKDFSERCEVAKSEAIKKLGKRATPDYLLKVADQKTFNIAQKVEGKIEGTLNVNIVNYADNNSSQLPAEKVSAPAVVSDR